MDKQTLRAEIRSKKARHDPRPDRSGQRPAGRASVRTPGLPGREKPVRLSFLQPGGPHREDPAAGAEGRQARGRAEGLRRRDAVFVAGRSVRRRPGAYNIPEPVADTPVADDETALVLMPGLAFDPDGHRCGYGGGFYDKYLAAHRQHVTLALCYDFQMFAHLDVDDYDIPVQYVLSAPAGEDAG